jgi:two-component system OmpR family response regulator
VTVPVLTAHRSTAARGFGAARGAAFFNCRQGLTFPGDLPTHLSVLDDEVEITTLLAGYLQGHGFRVSRLHSGPALLELMANDPPALVLLDLGLPGEDGFAIAPAARALSLRLVIVTGRGDVVDNVVGLEVGADDYATKAFDLGELAAGVKPVLRRLVPRSLARPSRLPKRQTCLAFAQ